MIDKPLQQITFADIERLVEEKWPEGKSIDYKRDTYGNSDKDKKELLKDVSSFANTQGGDILIGINAEKGVPIGIPGVKFEDFDKEKLRLEGIIRHGLEPRVDFDLRLIEKPAEIAVLIIRVKESLVFPLRVVFHGKFGEFWGRSSAGKYSMDTGELRRAFTLSDSIYEQIRTFRRDRVNLISRAETPMPVTPGGKLILHLIPVSAFRTRNLFNVRAMPKLADQFPPVVRSGYRERLNLDGQVTYCEEQQGDACKSYTQFFRNGIVETVMSGIVESNQNLGKVLRAEHYEIEFTQERQFFKHLMSGFREIGIQPPIWCFLTITGVKGAKISPSNSRCENNLKIDQDVLLLPEFVIDDLNRDPSELLRSTFDLVWNAAGYTHSFNLDQK